MDTKEESIRGLNSMTDLRKCIVYWKDGTVLEYTLSERQIAHLETSATVKEVKRC